MILQALYRYYDILCDDPSVEIARFGYSVENISFALNISADGDLLDIFPQFEQVQRGKKTEERPLRMIVPARVNRTVGVVPNFLWDNATYVLGLSDRESAYSYPRFEAFRAHNIDLLSRADSDAARALLAFLTNYDPEADWQYPAVTQWQDDLIKSTGNIVFMFNGTYVHEDPVICQVWEDHYQGQDAELMQCLVTGEIAPVERLHTKLKGVQGGQPGGTSLVGFNAAAYESYNRSQGKNSPVSRKAAFAYTTVLNYLLSSDNPNRKIVLGDTTIVYWAESAKRASVEASFASILDPTFEDDANAAQHDNRKKAEGKLKGIADTVRQARPVNLDSLLADLGDEDPPFYILGLSPNASRASVRFFVSEPFTRIVGNIMAHYEDMAIVKQWDNQPDYIRVSQIVDETVPKKSRDRAASPLLTGALFRAILTNTPYPAALFNALITRIRAEMDDPDRYIYKINYVRAAAIKAYLIRKYRYQSQHPIQEALTMALNEQCTAPAYLLGRLFAVLEKAQQEAVPEAKATIKDRYFTSACASPASVFAILLRLSQHHLSKIKSDHPAYAWHLDRLIGDILARLDVEQNPIPARLTLDEQGVFILGYYHQRADIYTKKSGSPNAEAGEENQ